MSQHTACQCADSPGAQLLLSLIVERPDLAVASDPEFIMGRGPYTPAVEGACAPRGIFCSAPGCATSFDSATAAAACALCFAQRSMRSSGLTCAPGLKPEQAKPFGHASASAPTSSAYATLRGQSTLESLGSVLLCLVLVRQCAHTACHPGS